MMEVEGGGVMGGNQLQQEAVVGPQGSDSGDECGQAESAAAILLEELTQELRRESEECHFPYENPGIKERYQDTAHLIYKKTYLKNTNFLSFGTRRSSSVSQYGNTPLVLRKSKSTLEQWPSYNSRFGSNSTLADNDDGSDSVVTTPKAFKDAGKKSRGQQRCLQETNLDDIIDEDYDGADSGIQVHSRCENRKSFSQYDIHIPRNKDESLAFLANSDRKNESIDTMDADTDEDLLEGKDESEKIEGKVVKRKANEEFTDLRESNEEKTEIENNGFKTEVENNEILQTQIENQSSNDLEISKEKKEVDLRENNEEKTEIENIGFKTEVENNELLQTQIENQSSNDLEISKEKKEAEKLVEEMTKYTEEVKEIEKTEEHIVDEIVEEKFRDSIRKRRDGVKVATVEGMADKTTRYKLQVGMIVDKEKDVDETKVTININNDSEVNTLNKEVLIDDEPTMDTLDSHKGARNIDLVKDNTILVDKSLEKSNIQMENNLSTYNGANSEEVKLDNMQEISIVDKQMDNTQIAYSGAHSKEENLENLQEINMVDKQTENNLSTCIGTFSKDTEIENIQEINKVDIKGNSELSITENNHNRNTIDCQGNTKHRNTGKIIEAIDPIIVMRKEKCNLNSNEEYNENLFEIIDESKIVDSSVGNIIEGRLVVEVKSAPKTIKDESHQIMNKEKYAPKISKDESRQIMNKENVAPVISYKDVSPVNELFITEECDINNVDHVKSEFNRTKTDNKTILVLEASGRNCVYNSKNETTFKNEVQIKLDDIPSLDTKDDHLSSVDNNKENEKRLCFQNSSELTPVGSSSPNHPVRTSTDLNISLSEPVSSQTSISPKPPARKHKGHSSLPTSPELTPKLKARPVTQNLPNAQNNLDDINTTNVLRESMNSMQISYTSTKVKGSSDHLSVQVAPVVTSNDLNTSFEPERNNMLVNLPLRSPTPPKRSPRNSPRLARHKEASDKKRPTSLILPRNVVPSVSEPSHDHHNHSGLKASVSLSPSSIRERSSNKFNFPYFSLRKEKSKSSDQMLVSKHETEKCKSSVSLSGSIKNIPDSEVSKVGKQEGKLETVALIHNSHNDGRRVGTRSMLIEGTLKRNFIVIHPLDNSESVGLAPISPHSRNSEAHTIPKALESVKSKVSGAIGSKFDSLRKKTKKKSEEQTQLETEQSLQNTDSKFEKNIENNTTNISEVSSMVPENEICSIEKHNLSNVTPKTEGTQENIKSESETGMHIVTDTTPMYKTTLDPGQNLPPIIPEVTPLVGESRIAQQQNLVAVRSAPCGGDVSVIEGDTSFIEDQAVIENQVVSGQRDLVTNSNNTTSKLCVVM